MFQSMYDPEVVHYSARVKVFRPGERDPEWLMRAAEYDRFKREMDAERRAQAEPGFVARVRMAFNRA